MFTPSDVFTPTKINYSLMAAGRETTTKEDRKTNKTNRQIDKLRWADASRQTPEDTASLSFWLFALNNASTLAHFGRQRGVRMFLTEIFSWLAPTPVINVKLIETHRKLN